MIPEKDVYTYIQNRMRKRVLDVKLNVNEDHLLCVPIILPFLCKEPSGVSVCMLMIIFFVQPTSTSSHNIHIRVSRRKLISLVYVFSFAEYGFGNDVKRKMKSKDKKCCFKRE
jgi:hypothetical protein